MNNSPKRMTLYVTTGLQGTFGSDNRNASVKSVADHEATVTDSYAPEYKDGASQDTAPVTFNAGQVIQVKRARLLSRKAPGLVSSTTAGTILVGAGFDGTITSGPQTIAFMNWNEWEDKDFVVKVADDGSTLIVGTGSSIRYDDFNIQDAYASETFDAVLELDANIYAGE